MTLDRDLFNDFTTRGIFENTLGSTIKKNLEKMGLFGYQDYMALDRAYQSNYTDGRGFVIDDAYMTIDDEASTLMHLYNNYISEKPNIRNLVNILTAIKQRNTVLDHNVRTADTKPVTAWDLATNDVSNVGQEARLLLMHKLLHQMQGNYMFSMVATEYLRSVISKYDYTEYSPEAVDIIARIARHPGDRDLVLMLIMAVFSFTCISTFGSPQSNSKTIARMALQLVGSGVVILDYYFKMIYEGFKDVDLIINYNLLSSVYSADINVIYNYDEDVFTTWPEGQLHRNFNRVLRSYLGFETGADIDQTYYNLFTNWKSKGLMPNGKVNAIVKYVQRLREDVAGFNPALKAMIDTEFGITPHLLFGVLRSILEICPELDAEIKLRNTPIFESEIYIDLPRNEREFAMRPQTVGEVLVRLLSTSSFDNMPAWQHCLIILTYLHVDHGLPMHIGSSTMTADIKHMVKFYSDLYTERYVGIPYKFMLSP